MIAPRFVLCVLWADAEEDVMTGPGPVAIVALVEELADFVVALGVADETG